MLAALQRFVPALTWFPRYRGADLQGDLSAGITVAVMLIPQGMAYAMLAGLPPIVGLYASIVPLAIYALLGTSRQLAVGPVAMVSLMVATAVGPLAEPGSATFVSLAVALALLVGVMQLAMGLFKLGFLVRFLSHPVISGFTSAAALIIGLSQLKHLLGVKLPRSHYVHEILIQAGERLSDWNWIAVAIGVSSIVVLLGLKRFAPRVPGALVVVAAATGAVWAFDLQSYGVSVVGEVPAGIPMPSLPNFTMSQLTELLPTALAISLVGFMESISVAKAFAARNKYRVDADQELVALGAANLGAAFFGGYPVTGGFSRTAVNGQAGARTGLASLITAGAIALALLTITPVFAWLPSAVLAAIVMAAVFGLIDIKEVVHLWHVRRSDLLQLGVTFVATLALGIELGIGVGVGVSLLQVIWASARPKVAVLGQVPGKPFWRDTARIPGLVTFDEVAVLRVDARLYFANVAKVEQVVEGLQKRGGRSVVLDCGPVNDVDSSALGVLAELERTLSGLGARFVLARVKADVRDQLAAAHVEIEQFDTVQDAVSALRGEDGPDGVEVPEAVFPADGGEASAGHDEDAAA